MNDIQKNFHENNFQKCEEIIKKSINNENIIILIKSLFSQEKTHEAYAYALLLHRKTPSYDSLFMLGVISRALGEVEDAIFFLKLASGFGGRRSYDAEIELIYCYILIRDFKSGLNSFSKLGDPKGNFQRTIFAQMQVLLNEKATELAIQAKNKIKKLVSKEKPTWIFINEAQLGDVFLFCSYMEAFKKDAIANLGCNSISVGVRLRFLPIAKMFLKDNEIFILPEGVKSDLVGLSALFDGFRPNEPLVCKPKFMYRCASGFIRQTRFTGDSSRSMGHWPVMLNLHKYEKPSPPIIKNLDPELMDKYIFENNIGLRKSVILCPHANSIDCASLLVNGFWEKIARSLLSLDYIVYRNVGPEETDEIEGVIDLNIPFEILIPVFETIGNVISARSGLCDIVLNSAAKKAIVYPGEVKNNFLSVPLKPLLSKGGDIKDFFIKNIDDEVKNVISYIKENSFE